MPLSGTVPTQAKSASELMASWFNSLTQLFKYYVHYVHNSCTNSITIHTYWSDYEPGFTLTTDILIWYWDYTVQTLLWQQ